MMTMDTLTLPAFLAPALVNGDDSGINTPNSIAMLADVLAYLALRHAHVKSYDGSVYFDRIRLPNGLYFSGEVCDYTVFVNSSFSHTCSN